MSRERNRAPFTSFGADMKQARQALGYTQKSLAEAIGIDPRYLANIENSEALPRLLIFYEIVRLCKLPVCPERYLAIVEGTIDAAIKLDEAGKV
jgi:transcriptional regulator with XRE-family HTH domain